MLFCILIAENGSPSWEAGPQESLKVSSVLPEFWLSDGEKSGLTSPLFSYPNVSPHGENAIRRKNHTGHFRVSDRCN